MDSRTDIRGFLEQELCGLLDRLYGAALRLTRNQADAEDLVADAVTKALASLDTLKDKEHFRPWMFRILMNTFISDCRKRAVRPQVLEEDTTEDGSEFWLFEKLHQPFLLWWGTPEQEFLNKILREDLERAVDALPEVFRLVVVLIELEGFSYEEAARMLRTPVGTIRSRLARGRSLLQKALWQHATDAGLKPADAGSPMSQDGVQRKLTAIFYADVAGYSRLTGDDETSTHHTLSTYLDMITAAIGKCGGKVAHLAGDAVLADFGSVLAALNCAVAIQGELKAYNDGLQNDRKMQFRIGINVGDVIVDRNDIYGDGVNVAARLESLAEPGGICVSGTVYDAVENRLPLSFEYTGEHAVKNITKPVRVYRVNLEPSDALAETSNEKRVR